MRFLYYILYDIKILFIVNELLRRYVVNGEINNVQLSFIYNYNFVFKTRR